MARTIIALMLREMTTTYGRTPGGYIWAVLQPIGAISIFTLVMTSGLQLRTPGLGTSFPIFYASGVLPFQMFNIIGNRVGQAVPFSRALLNYPRVTYIDAILARVLLNALTQFVVFGVVLGVLIVFSHANTRVDPVPIMLGLCLAVLFATGFGTFTGYLFQVYPVLASIWGILAGPLMLLSGVIFLFDGLARWVRDLLWYNPLVHIIGLVRRGIYPIYDAPYVSVVYVAAVSLILLVFGLMLMFRYHKDILSR